MQNNKIQAKNFGKPLIIEVFADIEALLILLSEYQSYLSRLNSLIDGPVCTAQKEFLQKPW